MSDLRKEFNSKVRNAYLKDNNICECEKCKKDRSISSLHVHHIMALADGGTNDYNNLIVLCTRCHDEWHSIEGLNFIELDKWLKTPPYFVLVNVFHEITELLGNLSPARIKRMCEVQFNLYKKFGDKTEDEVKDNRRNRGIKSKIENGELNDYGRPRVMDFDKFALYYERVLKGELKTKEVMELLNITKTTYYRYVKEYNEKH